MSASASASSTSNPPLVSIVVPTFNQVGFIEDCLRSILGQTYRQLEVIVQDSCSTDGTEEICNRFAESDSRLTYVREKDRGQSDAINRGLHRSRGFLWTWICSDDRYAKPDAIDSLVRELQRARMASESFMGCFGLADWIDEGGQFVRPYVTQASDIGAMDFARAWPLAQPASLLLRQRVVDSGGVVEDLHLGMDLDLFIRVLGKEGRLRFVPQKVADARIQKDSKSVKQQKLTALTALSIVKYHFGSLVNPFDVIYAENYADLEIVEHGYDLGFLKIDPNGPLPPKRKLKRKLQRALWKYYIVRTSFLGPNRELIRKFGRESGKCR